LLSQVSDERFYLDSFCILRIDMAAILGFSRLLLPVQVGLLALSLLAPAVPTQAQTAGHNNSSRRDYYYPQTRDPYRTPSDSTFSSPNGSTTIVRPVIIDNRIQNSTVIGPVIVSPPTPSPQRPDGFPAGQYPAQTYPSPQPARRTDAACMSFNELRIACQL
jgi:hypothetical protein